jgi:hypothetical protein
MNTFNPTRPNPYAYWNMGRLHAHDEADSLNSSLARPSVSSATSFQWQTYQRLELLPFCDRPQPTASLGLNSAWNNLLQQMIGRLTEKQRRDYLERCWASDPLMPTNPPIKQFWSLIR